MADFLILHDYPEHKVIVVRQFFKRFYCVHKTTSCYLYSFKKLFLYVLKEKKLKKFDGAFVKNSRMFMETC